VCTAATLPGQTARLTPDTGQQVTWWRADRRVCQASTTNNPKHSKEAPRAQVTTPPPLQPDHHIRTATTQPKLGGYGIVSFYRDIATMLARAPRQPTPAVHVRYNRDRPSTPQVSHGQMTIAGHQVTVVVIHPPTSHDDTVYALLIDAKPVDVEPAHHQPTDVALATAAWIALMDLRTDVG